MIKRLIQHGNSAALVIDKPILEMLNITNITSFEISTDGRNLILSPLGFDTPPLCGGLTDSLKNQEIDIVNSLVRINKNYRNVLKKLSE